MKSHEYLRNVPIFFSRLGFNYDPPRYDKNNEQIVFSKDYEKFRKFHADFEKAGVNYHTTILNSGWVGDKVYDYRLTDETLDGLLKDNPDILYVPRVKLNAPIGWCKNHPEDVFVYEKYKHLTPEEIAEMCGTLEQDYLGFESPCGYAVNGGTGEYKDDRPNVNGKISLQSFTSHQWVADASEALEKLIDHIQNGPYAKQIVGYHIAYGPCGETCLWGGWRARKELQRGDFSKVNRENFIQFGLNKYQTEERLLEKWGTHSLEDIEIPTIEERDSVKTSLRELFYDDNYQLICRDYNEYMSEANAKASEAFCKTIKDKTNGEAAAGIFFGYIYLPQAAYNAHCSLDTVLNSPYIDFVASPKGYFRSNAGEPGGEQGPTYSINKKKVWLDEIDNWTHLDARTKKGKAKDFFETRTLIVREGIKNLSTNQGFWWMDLGEGWYDMPEIMELINTLHEEQKVIEKKEHKSVSEILIVVDEKSIMSMSASYGLTGGLLCNLQSELRLCGAPVDTLRLHDLYETDIEQYKLIVFANVFQIEPEMKKIIREAAKGKTYVWHYAAGILAPNFSIDNVERLTGFQVKEFANAFETEEFGYKLKDYGFGSIPELTIDFPLIEIVENSCDDILDVYPNGKVLCGKCEKDGGTSILCTFPSLLAKDFRQIALDAGCKMYAPLDCTVYADNRLIGIFPKKDEKFILDFGSHTVGGSTSKMVSIKANGAEYYVYD